MNEALDRIYNLDCMEGMQRLYKKYGSFVDLVVTDPPYDIKTSGGGIYTQADKGYVKEIAKKNLHNGFSSQVLDNLLSIMRKVNIYIWCSKKQIPFLIDYFVKNHKCNFDILTWHKTNPIPACGNKYLTDTEFLLFFREKGVKVYGSYQTKLTYYVTPLNATDKKKYGHPTIKPLDLTKNLIINSSQDGQIVFDPFIGSGTTAVAAKQLNRRFIGFELDKHYYDIAKKRIDAE